MVLGSRTATILPRLTFSTFFFASHSSAHCSKGGRPPACACRSAWGWRTRLRSCGPSSQFPRLDSESRRERLFSRYQRDTNKNTNKTDGWDRMRTNGDEHRCTRKGLFFKGFRALRGPLRTLWNGLEQPSWCPWPESNQHSLRNSILSRARLPIPPQGLSDAGPQASVAKRAEYSGR